MQRKRGRGGGIGVSNDPLKRGLGGGGGMPIDTVQSGRHAHHTASSKSCGVVKQRILSYHMTPVTQAIRSSLFQVQC